LFVLIITTTLVLSSSDSTAVFFTSVFWFCYLLLLKTLFWLFHLYSLFASVLLPSFLKILVRFCYFSSLLTFSLLPSASYDSAVSFCSPNCLLLPLFLAVLTSTVSSLVLISTTSFLLQLFWFMLPPFSVVLSSSPVCLVLLNSTSPVLIIAVIACSEYHYHCPLLLL
jgi:hypothetical protein